MPKLTKERAKESLVNRLEKIQEQISNAEEFAERYDIRASSDRCTLLDLNVTLCDIIGSIEES